jgi:hypothetical protein
MIRRNKIIIKEMLQFMFLNTINLINYNKKYTGSYFNVSFINEENGTSNITF